MSNGLSQIFPDKSTETAAPGNRAGRPQPTDVPVRSQEGPNDWPDP